MLNSMLPLVQIMIFKQINHYQSIKNMHGCKVWVMGFKYTNTFSFHIKQNVEI
jgi:hypothetical protein